MSEQVATITSAIAIRQSRMSALQAQHSLLIEQIALHPEDERLAESLVEIEGELARSTAAVTALDVVRGKAREAAAIAAQEYAKRNSEKARKAVLKAASDRKKLAASVDETAAAFLDSLRLLRQTSQALAIDANGVLRDRATSDTAFLNMASQVAPQAGATSSNFAAALACVLREAIELLGKGAMNNHVVSNEFASVAGATFVAANDFALKSMEARL